MFILLYLDHLDVNENSFPYITPRQKIWKKKNPTEYKVYSWLCAQEWSLMMLSELYVVSGIELVLVSYKLSSYLWP